MISFWIKNMLSQGPESLMQGAKAFERKMRSQLKGAVEDVVDEIPSGEDIRRRSKEFMGVLLNSGNPIDRLRLWLATRRKVKKHVADFYDLPEITEEVTEKLLESSMEDPRLQKLLNRSRH
jgi:hypothetical protein